jgi:hypothetical protein
MLFALRFTWLPVPLFAARMRVIASVLPSDTLNLELRPDGAGFQVHI